jgi:hypothetical protein
LAAQDRISHHGPSAIRRSEDHAIKSFTSRHLSALRPLAGLGLAMLCLVLAACQTTARRTMPIDSEDVDRSVTLPRTLENVWYRPETQPDYGIPFAAAGTLLVSTEAILFNHGGGSLSIPVRDIRGVVWRPMQGDLQTEWAVIRYLEDGREKLVGFTAADRYRFHTSNKELYSAIVVTWESQAGR